MAFDIRLVKEGCVKYDFTSHRKKIVEINFTSSHPIFHNKLYLNDVTLNMMLKFSELAK